MSPAGEDTGRGRHIPFMARPEVRLSRSGKPRVTGFPKRDKALWELAESIVARERKDLRRRYGSNVRGIAVGYRTKGEAPRVYRQLVIRCYVMRKISAGGRWPSGTRPVPPYFEGRMIQGRRRQTVRVPTDITEWKGGGPHVTTNSPGGITIRVGSNPGRSGTLCALVRERGDPNAPLLALTCRHVVPNLDSSCALGGPADMRYRGSSRVIASAAPRDLGRWSASATSSPTGASVDAVLCTVLDATTISSRIGNIRPVSAMDLEPEYASLVVGTTVTVMSHRGRLKGKITAKPRMAVFGKYTCGSRRDVSIQVARAIEYDAPTKPGDSGSPVYIALDSSGRMGTLVGIHFWGMGRLGYATFLGDVLAKGAFPGRPRLTVVRDHNV